jgi:hypothetical protein
MHWLLFQHRRTVLIRLGTGRGPRTGYRPLIKR